MHRTIEELISSNFRGIYGAAALFHIVKNVSTGRAEPREMLTGRHIVRSINCLNCGNYVGWDYEFANERSQQGKEGKYVLELEKCKVKRGVCRYSTV